MFIEAIIIGIILGFIKKGRISNLRYINFKFYYLPILAILVQILPFFFSDNNFFINNYKYLTLLSFGIIFLFLFLNIRKKGFKIVLLGTLLNIFSYLINNYSVPIRITENSYKSLLDFKLMIDLNEIQNYVSLYKFTHINEFLGKFFIMPKWYIFTKYFSIGDILVMIGIIIFIENMMRYSSFIYNEN